MITESEVKRKINQICNGGPGSGNPAPGQGRGVGKPGAGAGGGMKTRDIKGKSRSEKIASVKQGDTVEIEPIDTLPNFDKKIKVDQVGDDYFRYGITEYSDGKDYPFYAIKDIKKISYENNKDDLGSSKSADEIRSIVDSEVERLLRGDPPTGGRQKSEKIAKKLGLGENGANYIHFIASYKAQLKEAEEYLERPRKSSAQEERYKKEIPELKSYIAMYEKVLRKAIEKSGKE